VPVRDEQFGVIAFGHLGRIGLDLVPISRTRAAAAAPNVIGGPV
jgi:hypothetical protein